MSVRTTLLGGLAAALAGTALAVTAAPAQAAVDPDDTTFTATTTDLIGAGSDTSQHAIKLLADAWNGTTPAPTSRIATYAATGGGDITLPSGAIGRPNGSTAGKALLFGTGNNTDIDFARSSSQLNTAEVQAGLQAFPFALDTLKMAVSSSSTNAPASLTIAQIVSIYKGDIKNWNEVGGTAGLIAPKIPQAGSGTRSFFLAQLKAANGGTDVVLGTEVQEVQEHDDTAIKNNPNAIAPFSEGRASLLGGTLRLEGGFKADRALYDVVRGSDLANTTVTAVFGSNGWVCSTEARDLIEQAGFSQLARPEDGGVCGAATQNPTTNFTLNEEPTPISTDTTLTATSPAGGSAKLVTTVTGSTTPQGTVDIEEDGDVVADDVPLQGGTATRTLTGVAAGEHTYTAIFTPAEGTAFVTSEDTDTVSVKTASKTQAKFPAKVKANKADGKVTVSLTDSEAAPTGKVVITEGKKVVGSGKLKDGVASITVSGLSKGKHKLTASWDGDDLGEGSSDSFTITRK